MEFWHFILWLVLVGAAISIGILLFQFAIGAVVIAFAGIVAGISAVVGFIKKG